MILGIGNLSRGDDGVGLVLAGRLAAAPPAGVVVREASGEGTGLMALWAGFDRVVVLDAVRTGSSPGTVTRLDVTDRTVPADLCRCSSHLFGVGEAIELARVMGRLPNQLVVVGVEGGDFGFGQGLSPAVEAALEKAEERVRHECA